MTTRLRWTAALATGYILMFFSEFLFVNVYEEFDLGGLPLLWLVYSLEAYLLLAIIAHFRVRNRWALFLAGAVYGWLLEGVVVQTMYAAFPFQVAFTGLSWHALIDVLVGVWLVRRALHGGSLRRTARLAVLIGLFWGLWAIWWAWEVADVLTAGEFALFAFGTGLPLIPAYRALAGLEPFSFRPQQRMVRLLAGLHVAIFVLVVAMIPYAALVLPPLLLLIYGALRRHRRSEAPARLSLSFEGHVSASQYAALALIPAVAAAAYALLMALEANIETNVILALATVPLSVWMFIRALWKLYRERPAEAAHSATQPALAMD
jgi:hypothetical protein